MIPEDDLRADSDFVAAWVRGWAISRGVPAPVPAFGGWRVDVGAPDQKARYVFAGPVSGVSDASLAILEPHVFIKVCASPAAVRPLLDAAWSLRPASFMMSIDELGTCNVRPPHGYTASTQHGAGCVVSLHDGRGELAARGGVFLCGNVAVFDRIETDPAHRRRGLGRIVMGELGRLASMRGARRGALVATPDGRALYQTLGWRLHCLYTTAVREPPGTAVAPAGS